MASFVGSIPFLSIELFLLHLSDKVLLSDFEISFLWFCLITEPLDLSDAVKVHPSLELQIRKSLLLIERSCFDFEEFKSSLPTASPPKKSSSTPLTFSNDSKIVKGKTGWATSSSCPVPFLSKLTACPILSLHPTADSERARRRGSGEKASGSVLLELWNSVDSSPKINIDPFEVNATRKALSRELQDIVFASPTAPIMGLVKAHTPSNDVLKLSPRPKFPEVHDSSLTEVVLWLNSAYTSFGWFVLVDFPTNDTLWKREPSLSTNPSSVQCTNGAEIETSVGVPRISDDRT
mmetsp:Transcript_25237/g.45690  ORF Transcript_25237/g.45690 Transcript_25237/m.45690 type:complete len:292 (-) Transcript_25237:1708-2583(-)